MACLREEPLEALLEASAEDVDLRDRTPSQEMIAALERAFLGKLIDRLDSDGRLLLESLAVFRRPFVVDAMRAVAPHGLNVERGKAELASRFMLGRDRKWYSLHPIARQLTLPGLEAEARRTRAMHSRAADFYLKRVDPTSRRSLLRAAGDFVESRYHLLRSDRELEFFGVAANYRELLRKNYQNIRITPTGEPAVHLIPVLIAALDGEDSPQPQLRTTLAELLVQRNWPGDEELALRHVTLATRASDSRAPWLLRVRLSAALDTPRATLAVAQQALERTRAETAAAVVVLAAELLAESGNASLAFEAVNLALTSLPASAQQRIYTIGGYLLTQQHRVRESIEFLTAGYRKLGSKEATSYRLFEQAAFLSFHLADQELILQLRAMILEDGINEHQPVLCEILIAQLDHDYARAVELGGAHLAYPAIAAQVAFSYLCLGRPSLARKTLDATSFTPNPAQWWIRGVVCLCLGAAENYLECMGNALGRPLSPHQAGNPTLWLELWDEVPSRLGIYPAFYFPRLPPALTQLEHDLHRSPDGNAVFPAISPSSVRLPFSTSPEFGSEQVDDRALSARPSIIASSAGEVVIHVIQEASMGDTYNVYGQAGSVGRNSSANDFSLQQLALGDPIDARMISDIQVVLDRLRQSGQAEPVAELSGAIEAIKGGDNSRLVSHLRRAGARALEISTEIGARLLEAALKSAMGLP